MRATSLSSASSMRKFHAFQFSALTIPTVLPSLSKAKRILPSALRCTIRPISLSSASDTIIDDLMIFFGRVRRSSTWPDGSVISNLWVMN